MKLRYGLVCFVCLAWVGCAPSPETEVPTSNADLGQNAQKPAEAAKSGPAAMGKEASSDKNAAGISALDRRREKILSGVMGEMFETQHLLRGPANDAKSKAAFKDYMDRLDPAKLFLLQSQADTLKKHELQMDDQFKSGNLELAREGGKVLKERVASVKKMVDEILAKPFDFALDETWDTDAEKRAFCKTDKELKERWRKVLKLQMLERIELLKETDKAREEAEKAGTASAADPSKEKPTEANRPKRAKEALAGDYSARFARLEKQEHIDEINLFINSMASSYDPHTTFLPPAQKENFDIHMSGSLEGIGAVLGVEQHYVKVIRVVPGSASWKQGDLEAGDLVLMVAQGEDGEPVDVLDMRLNDVVRLIRGKKGTVVKLTVKKSDGRILNIPIVREVVQVEEAYARGAMLKHSGVKGGIGYIDLPSFYGGSAPGSRQSTDDVKALLEDLKKKGAKSVIIDLRGNGGGLLQDARRMSGLFFKDGPVVQTRGVNQFRQILSDSDPSITFGGHVVVLVDRFSASASEILAGALQDYARAVVVGTSQTHGKGTVQVLLSLDRAVDPTTPGVNEIRPLGVLKLTTQQFFRVNGASTQRKGVEPDIILPDPADHIESGERFLDAAIPWSSVEPLKHEDWTETKLDISGLKLKSEARQAKNDAFQRVSKRTKLLRDRREETVVSLKGETWKSKRDKEIKELEALSIDFDEGPVLFDVDVIKDKKAKPIAPPPGGAKDGRKLGEDPLERWTKGLSRDPWVEESIFILRDMAK